MIWLAVLLALYLAVLLGIAWFSLRPFRTPLFISPAALGLPQEELVIPSSDGVRLASWWVPSPCRCSCDRERACEPANTGGGEWVPSPCRCSCDRERACEPANTGEGEVVAVLCHGYVMNRSELTPVAHWLWQRGVSCLLFEFRAHGHTRGGKSTIGVREADDVRAAVSEARSRAPNARIVVIGSSMGAAATALAAKDGQIDAVVLDSCYSKLVSAAFGWWRFLGGKPLSWILGPTVLFAAPLAGINPFKVDIARALAQVDAPVLFLHGRCDDLALPKEAERNLKATRNAEIVWFEDCGHSEFRWVQSERYYQALEAFLIRHNLIQSSDPQG